MRVIAALSVIAIHVTSNYPNSTAALVWNQAMRYAVPLFILMSGFLLAYSDLHKEDTSYRFFFKKKFKRVVVPYITWTFIYFIYVNRNLALSGFFHPSMLLLLLKHLTFGTAYIHFYFLNALLQLYLLYPLLKALVKLRGKQAIIVTFLISLASQIILYLRDGGVITLPDIGVGYARFFPIWLFYFVLGMYLVKKREGLNAMVKGLPGYATIGALVLSFGMLWYDGKLTGTFGSSMKPTVIVYALISFVVMYKAGRYLSRILAEASKWRKALVWLSENSFFVFLFHPLLLNLLFIGYGKFGLGYIFYSNLGMVLTFGLTVIGSSVGVLFTRLFIRSSILGLTNPQ